MLDNSSLIFIYAVISHGSLLMATLLNVNIFSKKILYIIGHILLTCAMFFRTMIEYRGSLLDTTLGMSGHSSLLLYFVIITFFLKHKKKSLLSFNHNMFLNTLCIIGQIGMIYTYYIEYYNKNEVELPKLYIHINNYLFVIVFSLLAYFYLRVAIKKSNKENLIKYSTLLVSILYVIFMYKPIHKYIITDVEELITRI